MVGGIKLNNINTANAGCSGSIPVTLFIVFLILKLVGVITWSWLWVLAPLWIPLALGLAVFLVGLIIVVIFGKKNF